MIYGSLLSQKRRYVMRKRLVSPWAKIIGLCIVGFLISGVGSSRVIAQSQPEEPRTPWQKIVVIPFFKGRRGAADAGDNVSCPICQLSFQSGSIASGADRTMTSYVQRVLEDRYGEKVIPLDKVMEIYEKIPKNDISDTPRSIAQRVGDALRANFVIVGTLWRYRTRIQNETGQERGASVAFDIYLIEIPGGKTVWKSKFDETQRPLSEDIRGTKVFFKRGVRWLTADELARHGVEEALKKLAL
jgi:hypothetical protein